MKFLPPSFLLVVAALGFSPFVRADDPALPGSGFEPVHYETLWTKSPFSVASSDAPPESADYMLVGLAQFDGVSYANLVDKQSNEHFLLASDKPVRGLTLTSVTQGKSAADTFAVVQRNGESLTLRMEEAPTPPPGVAGIPPPPIAMPGAIMIPSNMAGQVPPPVTLRHRIMRIPPPPNPSAPPLP